MRRVIRFNSYLEEGRFMSNFAATPFELDGRTWPTAEHAYHAHKAVRGEDAKRVWAAKSAVEAKRIGHAIELRPDWDEVKIPATLRVLRAKFSDPHWRAELLATGDAELVHHASWDSYWGDGGDGSGKNKLGELLMQMRDEFREATNMDDILFGRIDEEYGIFSNFAPTPFEYAGRVWPTAEHAFQAAKTDVPEEIDAIAAAETPKEAKRLGREATMREFWDDEREEAMFRVLLAKYKLPEPRAKLLSTGDARIVEHAPWDSYWGDGGDGTGQNRLGALLMQVRHQIGSEVNDG